MVGWRFWAFKHVFVFMGCISDDLFGTLNLRVLAESLFQHLKCLAVGLGGYCFWVHKKHRQIYEGRSGNGDAIVWWFDEKFCVFRRA